MIFSKHNGYGADGLRTCHKGGGSSKSAEKMERQRQERIQAAVNTINNIFDSAREVVTYDKATSWNPEQDYFDQQGNRIWSAKKPKIQYMFHHEVGDDVDPVFQQGQDNFNNGMFYNRNVSYVPTNERQKLYDEHKEAIYDINSRDVERQYENAERSNRFGLARNGLLGGSVDIDSNAELQRKNNEGLMQATGLADSAAANLKLQDERNRQSLISMAQSDIGSGTAQSLAQQSLDNAADSAYAERATASIGSLFDDMGQAYLTSKYYGNSSGDASGAFNLNNSSGTVGQTGYEGRTFYKINE
ncbi:hypothetical protein NB640_11835 [Oxalobacter vibrioformis]|uniref:Uncharacterized protein n=1 Tax=Oxalobacter vibrioformis TaxID=933080 RepID=A0A9E9LZV8_9BURK|nr:hypothetical protein [Oxalobacter vibrioformis]WAW09893.1 hypothetical protein NB640_11835 [Oxalobacter vibrioformis]